MTATPAAIHSDAVGSGLPVIPGDHPAYTASQLKMHQLLQ